jgi:hypothetical protein
LQIPPYNLASFSELDDMASFSELDDIASTSAQRILWLMGNMINYTFQTQQLVTLIDYMDFMKRSR